MTINGYARLVGFDEKLKLEPDILEAVDVVEDRIYTFHIREGHKWSDGSPVTTEDFRYTFEDVLLNEDISSGGLPGLDEGGRQGAALRDRRRSSVRFTWEMPNPDFLPKLASAQPIVLLLPSALHEAVPQEVPGRGQAQGADEEVQGQEVDRAAHQDVAPVPAREPRPADARPLAQHDGAASRAVRLRAQSLLPPRRRNGCSFPTSTGDPRRLVFRHHRRKDGRRRKRTCRATASTSPTTPS